MTFCALVTWLLIAAILLALMPLLADRLFPKGRLDASFCERLCRWWVILAFLLGIAVGGLFFCCREELLAIVMGSRCRLAILLALLLLLALLFLWLRDFGRCGRDAVPPIGRVAGTTNVAGGTIALPATIPALLLALLAFVRRCCAMEGSRGEPASASMCHWLLLAAIVLFLTIALLKFLEARFCDKRPHEDCTKRLVLWARLILAVLALLFALVKMCCDDMRDKEPDLAMVGIWWEGRHQGESGAHLRWSFKYGMPFPQSGFDIQRRPSSGGSWTNLNASRIHPANAWGDETAIAGDMSLENAVERVHPDVFTQFRGTPFADLADMVARSPYDTLWYVEEPEGFSAPSNPYLSETDAQAFILLYDAQPGEQAPLATWSLEPMTTLLTAAMHADIARFLGLYWIDETADPGTEYDYRVVGYWNDGTRNWVVPKLSKPNTVALDPPLVIRTENPITISNAGGVTLVDDQSVGVTWEPPPNAVDPDALFGPIDTIEPVLFTPERMPVTAIGTDGAGQPICPAAITQPPAFSVITRALVTGTSEAISPIAVVPIEDEVTLDLSWPRHFFVDRGVPYRCWAYRVRGVDLFAREAPVSSERVVKVADITGPPPPALVRATLYQKADAKLPADLRARFFPSSAPSRTFALHVTWAWTDEAAARAPDLKAFRILEHHTAYATFPELVDWARHGNWDLTLATVPETAGTSPLPSAYAPMTGRFFEATLDDSVTSLAALGLDAGDAAPVKYGWIGVASVDVHPWNNVGVVSAPVSIFGRDLVPPGPPDPPPALSGAMPPADERGNRAVPLEWSGNPLWTYQLWRADKSDLGTILTNPTAADLGTCASTIVKPSCNPATGGAECQAQHLDFRVRATAWVRRATVFRRVSSTPIAIEATGARTSDVVDAGESSVKLYATTAVDAAANVGTVSCPSAPILVEDGIAPRAPVVTKALAEDGEIRVTWAENPDGDLDRYTVYRTTIEADSASRRSMQVVAEVSDSGSVVSGGGAANRTGMEPFRVITYRDLATTPGTRTYYRVDAVDLSGNRSALSGVVANSSFDETPPDSPVWGTVALVVTSGYSAVSLSWSGETGARFQLQRRQDARGAWRGVGGSIDAPAYVDSAVVSGASYEYRVRQVDIAGNRSDWNAPRTREIP